jgi:hypothetical protein
MKKVEASQRPSEGLRLMIKGASWFVVLCATTLLCLTVSGCRHLQTFPQVPRCLIGEAGLICYDPKEDEDFILSFDEGRNYIAVSPESYEIIKEWIERRLHGKTAIECTVP